MQTLNLVQTDSGKSQMFSVRRPCLESEMKETFEAVFKNTQTPKQLAALRDIDEDNEKTGFLKNILKSIRKSLEEWHHYLVQEGRADENTSLLTSFKIFLEQKESYCVFRELEEELTHDTEWREHTSLLHKLLPLVEEWANVTEDVKATIEEETRATFNEEEKQLYQLLVRWSQTLNEDATEAKAVLDFMELIQKNVPILNENTFIHQTVKALEEVGQLVTQAAENPTYLSSAKTTGPLLAALEQWVAMTKEMAEQTMQQQMNKVLSEEERKLIDHLVQRYKKKNTLAGKKMYEQEAKVTKTDVKKWLSQALEKYASPKPISKRPEAVLPITEENSTLSIQDFMPVSKKEQWLALASSSSRVEEISNQLVRKITTALQHSPFLKNSNHSQQLTISLQPAHLGDITIRMAQVNGEMTVQLLTASKATKELLESNITQLRYLFAPQQISIEREEQVAEEEFGFEEENSEQGDDEEEMQEKDSGKRQQETEEDNVQADFHTLLHSLEKKEVVYEHVY